MKLIFHGGVNEIGGNKILLDDGHIKLFFDFGMSFASYKKFYSEFLIPRVSSGLRDLLAFDIIPSLEGIYRDDMLLNEGRKPTIKSAVNGVFVSHAHADHTWHLSLLHKDIKIHSGITTQLMLKAASETSNLPYYGDFYYYKENFADRRQKPRYQRPFETFKTGDKISYDHVKVEPVHVDHSIPGAYGFIIHTSKGAVVYTGDLRLHGPKFKMTTDFIDRAKASEPIAMICEGTKINEKERGFSEQEVYERVLKFIMETKGLVVINHPARDIDRFITFYNAAKASGRKLVIPLKQVYLYRLLKDNDRGLKLPSIDDENIGIYLHKASWGRYEASDYDRWEQEFLDMKNAVTSRQINANQDRYIFYCNYYQLKELIDIKPESGSIYIYSLSEPYDEEQEIDFQRLMNWLNAMNLKFESIHASGHASQQDLQYIINEIKPKCVIPVHTEFPEEFRKITENVLIPKKHGALEF